MTGMYYLYFQNDVFFVTKEESNSIMFYNFDDGEWKEIKQIDRRCYSYGLTMYEENRDKTSYLYIEGNHLYIEEKNKKGYINKECLVHDLINYLKDNKLQINFMFE